MSTLKSIGAVAAGFAAVLVLSVGTDVVLEKTGVFPNPSEALFTSWMLALALAYRSIYSIFGGFLAALLAPGRPLRHAIILGLIGLVFAAVGTLANHDKGPLWYPIALIVLTLPTVWLGAVLRIKAAAARPASSG
jgi:hypothetical protein